MQQDCWIMDGTYGGTLEARLDKCDTIIFLDFPRFVCLYRALKRFLMYRRSNREDIPEGCPERLSFEFLAWIFTYPRRRRPGVVNLLAKAKNKTVVTLRSNKEVRLLFDQLTVSHAP